MLANTLPSPRQTDPYPPDHSPFVADVHPSGDRKMLASSCDTESGSAVPSPNASCAPPASPKPPASVTGPEASTRGKPESVCVRSSALATVSASSRASLTETSTVHDGSSYRIQNRRCTSLPRPRQISSPPSVEFTKRTGPSGSTKVAIDAFGSWMNTIGKYPSHA